jgi:Holliday junction resolvasome RuvABC endonuclease subunit
VNDRDLERLLDTLPAVHVAGCDIATNTGAALFRVERAGPQVLGIAAARGGAPRDIRLATVQTCMLGGEWRLACDLLMEVERSVAGPPGLGRTSSPLLVVAWEDQYLGKNPRSMAVVVAARARLLFALELRAQQRGVALHTVAVNTMSWQSKVLGKARGKMRATIKGKSDEIAPMIAAACGSTLRPQGDAADATCIGLHEIARHFTVDIAAIRGESAEPAKRRRRR